jgi:hypothetical protein
MSFYNPSDSKFTRHYREEVDMVFSGLDCALHRDHVIYCSSELTSGLNLCTLLRERGLKTASELKKGMGSEWFRAKLWDVNVKAAIDFAEAVRHKFNDRTIVITPAPFSAPGWTQPEYLAFWETLLRTRIKAAWFNRNWQFSNGCVFEFAVALDAGLDTFDQDGSPLNRGAGIELIDAAIQRIDEQGLDASSLKENLERVTAVHQS